MSAVESAAGTAIGFGVAVLSNHFVLPLFGMMPSASDSFWIAVVFTAISLVRGYLVRRLFNRIHHGK